MKKNKEKAQAKANKKKQEKTIKVHLISGIHAIVIQLGEPSKKLRKLIEKSAASFSKEMAKTIKPSIAEKEKSTTAQVETPAVAKVGTAAKTKKAKATPKEEVK
ncbi:hypothetical protein [Pedobacter sp. ASV28]|uniref:hypothetical protein n=1 Tax=Pedobacter sp. ASV28 TaxID=2795123 RepID=UPI0018EBD39A|nr:hypothetical protein [Pedobacter sp. ASV28]